ncbi:MAG: aldehyde dehydrogenase family protein [Phycisphaeraceae bacterium]|nr:aldehyde dehydrogenase family protein [Phycisphaeraceae bacterium]
MLKKQYPIYIAGKPEQPNADVAVTNKYTGEVAAHAAFANAEAVERAIAAAHAAVGPMRKMPGYRRQQVLTHCVQRFTERLDELAESLCIEAGKPIKDARGEALRLIDTFRIAADESVRLPGSGEVMPMDISPRAEGYFGMWKRVPIGACSFITPFNFPLNLVAHKVAPALACGCPFVLKPPKETPIGALIIGEILAETDLPHGAFSVVLCDHEHANPLVEDDRIKLLSFTGSDKVGWDFKRRAGKKKVTLELGGNAACIVDLDADLEDAVARIIVGAFYQSGQSCISVQRLYVHDAIYDDLRARLVVATNKLKAGDPREEDTFIGPIISEHHAQRIEQWVNEAVEAGANVLCGGKREGAIYHATVIENAPRDAKVTCAEVFGPVVALYRVSSFDEALDRVNDSDFGLQAGVFTRDIFKAHRAWNELEVGGVLINEVPSWRVDHMPYGGVKDSGLGREGVRWSIEDMTEVRLFVLRQTAP